MEVVKLPGGISFEVMEHGYAVIASDGERIEFNESGKRTRILFAKTEECIKNIDHKKNNQEWLKYFSRIGEEERNRVAIWYAEQKPTTTEQEKFLNKVGDALVTIVDDYQIATIEPSLDEEGNIYYMQGRPVGRGITYREWFQKAIEFAPEYGSDVATLEQLFLWYAYRIVRGDLTLEYVCDDSSGAGNYCNAPKTTGKLEVTGAREVGGERDGQGNTCKIVRGIWYPRMCGGNCTSFGNKAPMANVSYILDDGIITTASTAVVVIKSWY